MIHVYKFVFDARTLMHKTLLKDITIFNNSEGYIQSLWIYKAYYCYLADI